MDSPGADGEEARAKAAREKLDGQPLTLSKSYINNFDGDYQYVDLAYAASAAETRGRYDGGGPRTGGVSLSTPQPRRARPSAGSRRSARAGFSTAAPGDKQRGGGPRAAVRGAQRRNEQLLTVLIGPTCSTGELSKLAQ